MIDIVGRVWLTDGVLCSVSITDTLHVDLPSTLFSGFIGDYCGVYAGRVQSGVSA